MDPKPDFPKLVLRWEMVRPSGGGFRAWADAAEAPGVSVTSRRGRTEAPTPEASGPWAAMPLGEKALQPGRVSGPGASQVAVLVENPLPKRGMQETGV